MMQNFFLGKYRFLTITFVLISMLCTKKSFSQQNSTLEKGDSMVWFTNLANRFIEKKNYKGALFFSKKAFDFAQKFHQDRCAGFFNAALSLQISYRYLDRLSESLYIAENFLDYETLEGRNEQEKRQIRYNALVNYQQRSELLKDLKDNLAAEKILDKIVPEYKNEFGQDITYATFLHSISTVKGNLQKYEIALNYALTAQTLLKQKYANQKNIRSRVDLNVAMLYEKLGQHSQARKQYHHIYTQNYSSSDQVDKGTTVEALHGLGCSLIWYTDDITEFSSYDNPAKYLEEVLQRTSKQDYLHASALKNLGHIYRKGFNDPEKANQYTWKANEIAFAQLKTNLIGLEENKQLSYFNNYQREFFFNFYEYALKNYQNSPELLNQMFDLRLATKSTILYEFLSVKRIALNSPKTELKQVFEELEALTLQNNLEEKENLQAQQEIFNKKEILKTKLSYLSQEFKNYDQKITWLDVQKKLKKNEAVIEVISLDIKKQKRYFALILTHKTSPTLVFLPDSLDYFVNSYYETVNQDFVYGYKDFWKPFEPLLKNIKKVYFSPDGTYHLINLNSLQNPENNHFLGDDLEIILLNSSKDLLTTNKNKSSKKAILFGNPAYNEVYSAKNDLNGQNNFRGNLCQDFNFLNNLPETQKEIEKIESLLRIKNYEIEVFCKEKATEQALKKIKSPSVLHIATHGAFCENKTQSPLLNSFLALAGISTIKTGANEGIFSAYEALDLDLKNTDLVVLSACETGKGKIENGEGVFGLQRAFTLAGTKNVLISLWKVDDLATRILMTYFYEFYLENQNAHEALKKAQDKFRKNDSNNPEFWAAFVIWGKD